jgi:hypothetical protein
MSRLFLLIICIIANVEYCNALCCKDRSSLLCNETPLFEYRGVVRKMHSNINVCDSLLSVYIEDKVQDLESKGFEGKFIIKVKLTIRKNGKVKKAAIMEKHKGMEIVYSAVYNELKKVKFKPFMKNIITSFCISR